MEVSQISTSHVSELYLLSVICVLTEHHLNQFLSVVPVTTAQTVRTTTRALAHVNRTCVQIERKIEEEEMIGLMPYFT